MDWNSIHDGAYAVAPFDCAEPKAPSNAEGLRSGCYRFVFAPIQIFWFFLSLSAV